MVLLEKIRNKEIILFVENSIIDDKVAEEILVLCKQNKRVAIDMINVKTINSRLFVNSLIENKFKLFNSQNEILVYLALILKDGFLKTHLNYQDFKENKREFIKRHFLVA